MSATGLPRASAVPQHVGCYSPSNLPKPKRRLLVGKSNRLDHAFTETALLEEVFVDKANLNVMQRQMRTEYKSANAVHDVLGSTRRANAALLDGGGHAGKRQNPRMSVIRPPPSPPPPPPRHFTGDRDEGVSLKSALETGTHPAVASLLRENRVGKGHTQRAEDFFLQTVDAVYSPPPANPSTAIKAPFVLTNLPATTNFGGGAMEHNDPQSYLYSRNEVVTRADIRDIREHEKMEYERTRDDVPKPPPYLFEPPVPKDGQVYIRAPWAAAGELAPIQKFSDEAEASKVGVRPNNVFLTPAELAEEDRRTIDRRRRVVEVREQRRQAQLEQAARVRRPPMPPRDLPSMKGSTVPSSKSSVVLEEEYLREPPAAEVEAVDCSARSSVRGSTASASPAQRPSTEVNVLNLEQQQQQQQQQDANNVPISPAQSRSRTSSHRTTPAASLHATSPAMSVRSASTATASVREQATPAASLHATSPAMSVRSASTATASVREQATPAASLHATSPAMSARSASTATASVREQATPAASLHATSPAMSVRSASTATASVREQATPAASIPPTPASTTPSSRRSGSQHETQHHRCAVPLSAAAAERARHPRRPNGEAAIPASPDDAWIESYTPTARPYDVGPFLGRCGYKDCRLTYHWVQPEANSAMHSRPAEYRSVSHVQLDTPNDWQRTHGGVRRYPHVPK